MNKKHILFTIIMSALATIMQSVISFLITPLVTHSAGVEAYGFVTLAKNFTSFADVIMIALNSYAARYITVAYLKNDKKSFSKYFNTVLLSDVIFGGIILVFGIAFITISEKVIIIPPELEHDVKLLFLYTFIAFFLTTCSTAFSATAYVKDKLNIYNIVRTLSYVSQIFVLLVGFLILDSKIWYVGVAILSTGVVMLIGSIIMTTVYLPDAKVKIRCFDKINLKILIKNGVWNSVNSLGNSLNSGLDLLITNLMISPIGMGQISVCKTVSNIVFALYGVLGQPFHPEMLKQYSNEDINGLLAVLRRAMQICGLFTNVILGGFLAAGILFYELWIPGQDTQLIYSLTIVALLPCIGEGCVYPLYYIYTLTVKNKVPCIVTIIGGITNVVSMYILIKYTSLGLYAVLLTTAIIMNVINLISNPLYSAHCLGVHYSTFYPQIVRNILSCGLCCLIMMAIGKMVTIPKSWIALIFYCLLLGIIGALVQLPIQFGVKESATIIKRLAKKL